jgi:hypothetical protein
MAVGAQNRRSSFYEAIKKKAVGSFGGSHGLRIGIVSFLSGG